MESSGLSQKDAQFRNKIQEELREQPANPGSPGNWPLYFTAHPTSHLGITKLQSTSICVQTWAFHWDRFGTVAWQHLPRCWPWQSHSPFPLELSAAIDTIDHPILHSLAHSFGVTGSVFTWVQSYLTRRSQIVRLGSHFSNPTSVSLAYPKALSWDLSYFPHRWSPQYTTTPIRWWHTTISAFTS